VALLLREKGGDGMRRDGSGKGKRGEAKEVYGNGKGMGEERKRRKAEGRAAPLQLTFWLHNCMRS